MIVHTASSRQTLVHYKNKGKRAMLSRQVLALNQVAIENGDSDYRKTVLLGALHLCEKCGNIDSEQMIKVNPPKDGGAKLWV
ncbi:hypothetical protein CEB3_c05240 [Peptococcaceae bacterium CEB3]|nr:hypothetical protein CEB3_c05240 [Peptococcaceae bacterium CEB3]